jgi:hypothetical protein
VRKAGDIGWAVCAQGGGVGSDREFTCVKVLGKGGVRAPQAISNDTTGEGRLGLDGCARVRVFNQHDEGVVVARIHHIQVICREPTTSMHVHHQRPTPGLAPHPPLTPHPHPHPPRLTHAAELLTVFVNIYNSDELGIVTTIGQHMRCPHGAAYTVFPPPARNVAVGSRCADKGEVGAGFLSTPQKHNHSCPPHATISAVEAGW